MTTPPCSGVDETHSRDASSPRGSVNSSSSCRIDPNGEVSAAINAEGASGTAKPGSQIGKSALLEGAQFPANATAGVFSIQRAEPCDAEAIWGITVSAWRAGYGGTPPLMNAAFLAELHEDWGLPVVRRQISDAAFVVNTAREGQALRGYAVLVVSPEKRDDRKVVLRLHALNVHSDHWRRGIARCLVMQTLTDAKDRGADEVHLWCIRGNQPAYALYEKCRFEKADDERCNESLVPHDPFIETRFVYRFSRPVA